MLTQVRMPLTPRPRTGAKVLAPGDRARATVAESAPRIHTLDHDELESWSLSKLEDGLAELKANEALRQVPIHFFRLWAVCRASFIVRE